MTTTALILAGHGSHVSPNTAAPVWGCVDTLRAWGVADEVTACFWKEAPAFHQALEMVSAREITIVPVFTAQGYFTQTVIPAEMGLAGSTTVRDGRTVHYARALGEHPYLTRIIRQRVEAVMQAERLDAGDVAVVVIGHGTPRDPHSREATRRQAELLRDARAAAEVLAVYLDDAPFIPQAFALTTAPTLIALPFFLAPGSHVTRDVPRALGLKNGEAEAVLHGRRVFYTPPVGTDEALCELLLELARGAGGPFARGAVQSVWGGFPAAGRDELLATVRRAGGVAFGGLQLSESEVRPLRSDGELVSITSPGRLRERARGQPFRPLATARDLPGGWRVPVDAPEILHAAVETVYPGAVADWAANRWGTFQANTLAMTAARQTGMFRSLAALSPRQIEHVEKSVCGQCVRHPTWYAGVTPVDSIPCREPCNFWMSAAKEHAR